MMKSKRSSRDPALRYARLCRFFGVSAIYFVIVVCTSGIFREMGAGALGLVVDAVLLAAGYFLMALWAKLTHFERRSDSRGYESDGGYFVLRKMILPIAVIIIAGFAIKGITARAEYEYAMSTPGVAYEPNSLYPFAVMLFCIAVMTGGAVLWFVPQERLVSQRTVACCIFAMFIPFVFYAYLGGAGVFCGVGLIGYTFATALALNQNSLTMTYRGTVMEFISPRARRYNMRLALFFCACVMVMTLGGWAVAVGLATLGKALLYIIVHSESSASDDPLYDTPEQSAERTELFNLYVFGAKEADDTVNYYIFIVFAIACVVSLIIFLCRNEAGVKRFLRAVRNAVLRLIDMIFSPVADSMVYFRANMREESASYIDTEEKLHSSPHIGGSSGHAGSRRSEWREFNAALGALKDENEKLRYAYSVFALQMQAMPQFAKKNDTPRELRGRLRRRGLYSDEDMAGITAAFEKAEYSGGANASEAREATAKLCRIIRRNMI